MVGDEVLLFMAQSLRSIFRKEDIIGRWGGDEFIIFLKEFSSLRAVTERLVHLRRKMKDFIVEDTAIPVSLSIGGAVSGESLCSLEALFQKADHGAVHRKTRRPERRCHSGRKRRPTGITPVLSNARKFTSKGASIRLDILLSNLRLFPNIFPPKSSLAW